MQTQFFQSFIHLQNVSNETTYILNSKIVYLRLVTGCEWFVYKYTHVLAI